jgi:class 3 adenylate cyclase/tetratricopeptide (TPR) repeat protein
VRLHVHQTGRRARLFHVAALVSRRAAAYPQTVTCAACGTANPESARFCNGCGAPLEVVETSPTQRKVVTVLFCDVTGSTSLGERLDPEALRRVMAGYFATARAAIERHGGTVEKFIGDAVMAVFGVPVVHEDDALRAVRAALELRDAVEIDVRIGVNTGEVVTGGADTLATGDAVNVAARLEQAAATGDVLIGAETYALVRAAVEAELLPPLEVKGKSAALTAYRVRRIAGGPARRNAAPMVGRAHELESLDRAFERAVREGMCHLFTLLGNAGVGKSRLVDEFIGRVDGARVLRGRCLSYGEGITYWSLVEILKQLPSLPEEDAVRRPLAAVLGELDVPTTPAETAWAARKALEVAAAERPLIVVFDDIQWGDAVFLDLIEHVADMSRGAPILLLCMARPELLEVRPGWGGGKLNATTVLLEGLGSGDTDALVELLLGESDPELAERIRNAAEGNPLFVEEMVELARESGGAVTVPPTIHALLAARLDSLPPAERAVLGRAAVEGQVFHRGAVAALGPEEPQVDTRLGSLVRKELVRPNAPSLLSEDAYRFRHLLIRDAAYEALPKETRVDLHERFGLWLDEHGADLVELDEIVGYHLEQASSYAAELGTPDPARAARAAERLAAAAARAEERGDNGAAANLLRRALDLGGDADGHRAELLLRYGRVLVSAGPLDGAVDVLREAGRLGEGVTAALARVLLEKAQALRGDTRNEDLLPALRGAVVELEQLGDPGALAEALTVLALALFWVGRLGESRRTGERALAYAREAGNTSIELVAIKEMGTAAIWSDTPWPEIELMHEEMLAAADRLGSRVVAWAQDALSRAAWHRGDLDEARRHLTEAMRIHHELGTVMTGTTLHMEMGYMELRAGELAAAERELRLGWEGLGELGEVGIRATMGSLLAEALARQGRLGEAEHIVRESERIGVEDDFVTVAEALFVRGLIASRRGDHAEAIDLARRALAIVDDSEYVPLHAEFRIGLAELLLAAGRGGEAEGLLREAVALAEAKADVVVARQAQELLERAAAAPTAD